MICIYDKSATKDTVLNSNGLAVLDDICTKIDIKEVINGEYGLTAIFELDAENNKHNFLVDEAIIRCPDVYGDEVFRINEVTKTSDDQEIQIYARHISYDCMNLFIESVSITNGNGAAFATALSGATTTTHEFTFSSDITNTATSDYANMSLYDALFTDQYCFLNMLGGEVSRQQYNIAINTTIGSNNGVKIQSRKNIQGFEIHTNMDGVITRIYPFGSNGLTIPEKYIDSSYIGNYATIKSRRMDFNDIGIDTANGITEAIAQQKLRDAVALKYSVEQVDIIKAEYSVDYVAVKKTEEYKNFSVLEEIYLGDIVGVYEENFDITINVRVVDRTYDPISELLASIELSNIEKKTKPNLKKIIDKINDMSDNLQNDFNNFYSEMHPKIYTGTTAPDASLGEEGDVYVQY